VVIIKDSKPVATLMPISDANLRFIPLSPAKMSAIQGGDQEGSRDGFSFFGSGCSIHEKGIS
jgi:hypothetical protein